jgi:GDPmannose 4,6-dehydratase
VTGQDGSFLAELLLGEGYQVHGVVRRASTFNRERLATVQNLPRAIRERLVLHYGDLGDSGSMHSIINTVRPDEVYHLAAQSHVKVSFELPEYTSDVTGLGTVRILDAVRSYQELTGQRVKFYQASSSEMFGAAPPPQKETTPFHPQSPYGTAKVMAYWSTRNYRESYGMFAVNGILFNHESPRRGEAFVSRKITRAVARIEKGLQGRLVLGNLNTRRDWGYAPEYVKAMWLMLQHGEPDDFVVGTGESHSVAEFLEAAFAYADLDWHDFVDADSPDYVRPNDVDYLQCDATKAREVLGWQPRTRFAELVKLMVDADRAQLQEELTGALAHQTRES